MSGSRLAGSLRDLLALTKPSITVMAVFVAAGALLLAPGSPSAALVAATLLGVALIVGSANALNMWLERDTDALMSRTRTRPLPAGRMRPGTALAAGLVMGALSVAVLVAGTNLLTAALGFAALLNYVLAYTPLKRVTPLALIVGAPSGAMPVLMGWTAATGRADLEGLLLFAVMFAWQLPHFLAISLFRAAEYERAGIRVVPLVRGEEAARVQAAAWTTALVPLSLALAPAGVAGWPYVIVALAVNAWFLRFGLLGLRRDADSAWARRFFLASLAYVPALALGLAVDALLRA